MVAQTPTVASVLFHPSPTMLSTAGINTMRSTYSCRNDWIAKSLNRNTGLRIEAEYEEHSFPISYHADWIASVVNLQATGLQLVGEIFNAWVKRQQQPLFGVTQSTPNNVNQGHQHRTLNRLMPK
jgi:hypothetical protein